LPPQSRAATSVLSSASFCSSSWIFCRISSLEVSSSPPPVPGRLNRVDLPLAHQLQAVAVVDDEQAVLAAGRAQDSLESAALAVGRALGEDAGGIGVLDLGESPGVDVVQRADLLRDDLRAGGAALDVEAGDGEGLGQDLAAQAEGDGQDEDKAMKRSVWHGGFLQDSME
jgi:hypothetical protein